MRFRSALALTSFCVLWVAPPARAEECPPGDWFCEPAPEPPETPAEPVPDRSEASPERPRKVPRWRGEFVTAEEPPPPPPPRRMRRGVSRREWGFDVHVLAALIGGNHAHANAGMGGLGFGFRYRPIPYFALDGTLELAVGTDYNGDERTESALLVNAMGFFNPQDRAQFYLFAGLGFGAAEVTLNAPFENVPLSSVEERYRYFGMQLGAGIEVRVTRRTALRGDLMGFVRARTDDDLRTRPEFVDPVTGRATNTSGGSLLRVGAIFYW